MAIMVYGLLLARLWLTFGVADFDFGVDALEVLSTNHYH